MHQSAMEKGARMDEEKVYFHILSFVKSRDLMRSGEYAREMKAPLPSPRNAGRSVFGWLLPLPEIGVDIAPLFDRYFTRKIGC